MMMYVDHHNIYITGHRKQSFEKIQHPFVIKVLKNLGKQRAQHNKAIFNKATGEKKTINISATKQTSPPQDNIYTCSEREKAI